MTITRDPVAFEVDGKPFEGIYVRNSVNDGARPLILVLHHWAGRADDMIDIAERMTDWGYHAVACDVFGKGVIGRTTEEKSALITPLMGDRKLLEKRLKANVAATAHLPDVATGQVAAVGFCFGGLCALDLARTNADVKGVASMHGLLLPRPERSGDTIRPRISVHHGWDDPMAPPEQVLALGKELTARNADWQIHAYGNTVHAFTTPSANDPQLGLKYNAKTARRAFASLADYFHELFAV